MNAYTIRKAEQSDIETLAFLHMRGLQASHEGSASEEFINAMNVPENIEHWTRWFAAGEAEDVYIAYDEDESAAGYIWFGPLKTPPPGMSPVRPLYTREIYGLFTLSDYWGKGLGEKLIRYTFDKMLEQKHQSVCLWVLKNNKRGCAFYKKMGGERCGKIQSSRGERAVTESCFGWRKIPASEV